MTLNSTRGQGHGYTCSNGDLTGSLRYLQLHVSLRLLSTKNYCTVKEFKEVTIWPGYFQQKKKHKWTFFAIISQKYK